MATRAEHEAAVMLWNYHDEEKAAPGAPVAVTIKGLPKAVHQVRLTHYRIDDTHSNAYTLWKATGSPQNPTPQQLADLKARDGLELLESPRWLAVSGGVVSVSTELPRQSISLLQLEW